jgi:hypothetical protein
MLWIASHLTSTIVAPCAIAPQARRSVSGLYDKFKQRPFPACTSTGKKARSEKGKEKQKLSWRESRGLGCAAVMALGLHGFSQDIWRVGTC